MTAPVKMKLARPTAHVPRWASEEPEWIRLNQESRGNPEFEPLTIKAAYIIGVVHAQCLSVECLLRSLPPDVSLLPAFGVFASSIDLLGRCINGNSTTKSTTKDLATGFEFLATGSLQRPPVRNPVVVQTSTIAHAVDDLVQLRHFASHGQGTASSVIYDIEVLERLPARFGACLDAWWNELQRDEALCNQLARANVIPVRHSPVLQSWIMFEMKPDGTHESITTIFSRFNWEPLR